MKAKRIDHLAIAVKDLDAAVATYQHNFGLEKVSGGDVPALGIRNAFLQIGEAQIELDRRIVHARPAELRVQRGLHRYRVRHAQRVSRAAVERRLEVQDDEARSVVVDVRKADLARFFVAFIWRKENLLKKLLSGYCQILENSARRIWQVNI